LLAARSLYILVARWMFHNPQKGLFGEQTAHPPAFV